MLPAEVLLAASLRRTLVLQELFSAQYGIVSRYNNKPVRSENIPSISESPKKLTGF